MKHTPEPWDYEISLNGKDIIIIRKTGDVTKDTLAMNGGEGYIATIRTEEVGVDIVGTQAESNARHIVDSANACKGMEDPETEIKRLKRYDEPEMKCNKGHVTLPLKLWDCPACTEELRRENMILREILERTAAELARSQQIINSVKGDRYSDQQTANTQAWDEAQAIINPKPEKRYKIKFDPTLNLSVQEQKTHHDRMARYGTWDGPWWTPDRINQHNPEGRIEREGYIIEETQP